MDISNLLQSKHLKVHGNKYFGWSCIVENGIRKSYTIKICGKHIKLSNHKHGKKDSVKSV